MYNTVVRIYYIGWRDTSWPRTTAAAVASWLLLGRRCLLRVLLGVLLVVVRCFVGSDEGRRKHESRNIRSRMKPIT